MIPDRASYGYSRTHRAVEIASIAAVSILLVSFAVRIAGSVTSASGALRLVLTALSAYVATDLFSGVVHWAGDTIGDERVPFLGPNFIKPFRVHHVDQMAITRHDLIETNGNNCILIAGPLAVAFLVLPRVENGRFFACSFMAFLALFVVATNQFHKWAHQPRPPRVARVLQATGLILTRHHHDIHHAAPHDRHYCITVGWLNPLLNVVGFFRGAEWLVAQVRPNWLHIEERARVLAPLADAQARRTAGGGGAVVALGDGPAAESGPERSSQH